MVVKEMVPTCPDCNPIKPEVEACSSMLSMQNRHIRNSMVLRTSKFKFWGFNYGVKTSASGVYLFHIIAFFAILLCKSPLQVDGLARADEEMNYLLSGPGEADRNEVVLQGSPYSARLERPSVSFLQLPNEDELEEILSVKLKLLRGKASAFRVFINLPDADEQTSITRPEFTGSYFHEPRRVKSPDFEYQETIFSIGIGDIIKDLGLIEQPSVLMTFVPCGADKGLPVVLKSMHIELA